MPKHLNDLSKEEQINLFTHVTLWVEEGVVEAHGEKDLCAECTMHTLLTAIMAIADERGFSQETVENLLSHALGSFIQGREIRDSLAQSEVEIKH